MEYYTLLLFGGLIGMQHALEADHLAAMAALSTGQTSRRSLVLRGSLWGLGHTLTLLSVCGVLLIWGGTISARTQAFLQLIVGVMIIFLGANVLYRLWKQRPHFHFHQHESGLHHLHAHTHVSETRPHAVSKHPHKHHDLGLRRVVMVGMIHGVAGSAGLLVLAASASSVVNALGYILAFGLGSILGMATLSFIASYPIGFIERSASWMNRAAMVAIGCAAMIIGLHLLTENWLIFL
jgi:ABC-type nickel/cobalt efflux system permease component RcnA